MKFQSNQAWALATVPCLTVMSSALGTPWASEVVHYQPGTGYATEWGTGVGYTDPSVALGEPSRITPGDFGGPVDPFSPPYLRSQLVSLGDGGSLTVRFDQPIVDHPRNPYGLDFTVFGAAGFVITNGDYSGGGITDGSLFGHSTGFTQVSVSSDGAHFYRLNPALAPQVDHHFPTDGRGDFTRPVPPATGPGDFAGHGLAGIRALYQGSGGGAGFDLAWAVDPDGQAVILDSVRFVRVDVVGDRVEIDGFAAVSPIPEPATWATLALGVSLMTWRAQKRRRAGERD